MYDYMLCSMSHVFKVVDEEFYRRWIKGFELLERTIKLLPSELQKWGISLLNSFSLGVYTVACGLVVPGLYLLRLSLELAVQLHYFNWLSKEEATSIYSILSKYLKVKRVFWLKMVKYVP